MFIDLENGGNSNIRKPEEIKPVEVVERLVPINEQANFKGNYSELLFSRMQNPVIRKQLLDLKEANEQWMAEHPPMKTIFKKDPVTGATKLMDYEEVPDVYDPKSRKELEDDLDEALKKQMSVTRISSDISYGESLSEVTDYDEWDESNARSRDIKMGIKRDSTIPLTENEIRNRSNMEAHEKGHVFRHLTASPYLMDKFSLAFDPSKLDVEKHLSHKLAVMSKEEAEKGANKYLFDFSRPEELIERMSQLKGYFGMKGDEKFTPQHLEYARDHYLKDGMDNNNMQLFFDVITPQTEFAFLKLINSIGV
ncbi:MAG: hypothetical protein WCK60_01765 [Candidatus Nomurabacteria bacterium]